MECILCGGHDFAVVTDRLRFGIERKVVRCLSCDLVSLENPLDEVVDYAQAEYRKQHGPVLGKKVSAREMFDLSMPFQAQRVERMQSQGLLTPQARILELGCSTGHFLSAIRDQVAQVAGIELNPEHAAFAREDCGLAVYDQELGVAPLEPGSFDVIVLFQVLEHIPDPLPFLALCQRYLRSGGQIYLEVPNVHDTLISIYNLPAFAEFYYRAPHAYYYSPATLIKVMEKAGYSGTVFGAQGYSMFNHIHWLLTGKPQPSQQSAYNIPSWELPAHGNPEASAVLSKWFADMDREYRRLVEKLQVSELICFSGRRLA